MDEFEDFEQEFQVFVAKGGLDETRSVNQEYELMRRQLICAHDMLRSVCPLCQTQVFKAKEV